MHHQDTPVAKTTRSSALRGWILPSKRDTMAFRRAVRLVTAEAVNTTDAATQNDSQDH